MIVVVTAGAERDLEDIASYVAAQSPRSALMLIRGLREKCADELREPVEPVLA